MTRFPDSVSRPVVGSSKMRISASQGIDGQERRRSGEAVLGELDRLQEIVRQRREGRET